MDEQIKQTVAEFRGVPVAKARVHESATLAVLLDTLLEKGLLITDKRRRQGKRGTRSARNHMLRKALWYARAYASSK
jgi:hypothetical protein